MNIYKNELNTAFATFRRILADLLSHTDEDNQIKTILLSFIVATGNVKDRDSNDEDGSETINDLLKIMLLISAKFDHKLSATTENDQKLAKFNRKLKLEKQSKSKLTLTWLVTKH